VLVLEWEEVDNRSGLRRKSRGLVEVLVGMKGLRLGGIPGLRRKRRCLVEARTFPVRRHMMDWFHIGVYRLWKTTHQWMVGRTLVEVAVVANKWVRTH
jgi:hypothetical protein